MSFTPADNWLRVTTIDAHTAGEPLRIITDGYPDLPGVSILEKRRVARERHDHLRRALMLEPRGHADMYGCVLTPPVTADGDVGVLFLHNEGYSTMCGHGIIALVKVGLECDLFRPTDPAIVRVDTPAGRVTATAHMDGATVQRVSFRNVPSFVLRGQQTVAVEEIGDVIYDLAYGGAFYAYVQAPEVGLKLEPANFRQIIDLGRRIKSAVVRTQPIAHPAGDPDLNFLYGVIFVQPGSGSMHSRNVCVFADGEVDRSPTGTGVSGRAAIHWHRGELMPRQSITIESLIGTTFDVRVAEETSVGGVPAIIPEVSGRAHITGRHEFLIDPADPLHEGVLLR